MSGEAGRDPAAERPPSSPSRRMPGVGLLLAPALALLVYLTVPGPEVAGGLEHAGRVVAAVGVAMAVLWLTEALPVAATALLPLATIPLLTGGEIAIREVAAPYAHELIFLYLGGFLLALAMQRWGLHRRIALSIISALGDRPNRVVLGFMLASAFLSMWISNTATVVMMLPIALSVVDLVRRRLAEAEMPTTDGEPFPFAIALLLGTAYAASIGGIATLIGTPPNLLLAAFVEDDLAVELSFASWLPLGLTVTALLLPSAWLLLTRVVFPPGIEVIPGGRRVIREELQELGRMTRAERVVAGVFAVTAALWVCRGWLEGLEVGGRAVFAGLTDPGIAMAAALVLFAWPIDWRHRVFLLDWQQARQLPWGILILFGGGLSLAASVRSSGVDSFIGGRIAALGDVPTWLLVGTVTVVVVLLTELTSNTATTATFLPILAAVAQGLGVEPMLLLLPMTLAASCAFMMPVATPPNAIVFGSGEITIPQMCRAGLWLNLLSVVVIVALVLLWGPAAVLGQGGR